MRATNYPSRKELTSEALCAKEAGMSDPRLHSFHVQRGVAKSRGVEWKLEFWEWLQIWEESGHFDERGPHKGEWVMGRNGDRGPYAADNVKIIRAETNNSDAQKTRRTKRAEPTRAPAAAK
jgi:hypothetical protein